MPARLPKPGRPRGPQPPAKPAPTAANPALNPCLPTYSHRHAFKKKIVIISGPNGAGKTPFAREFLPHEAHCTVFINADLIAAGLSPFAPELAATAAVKLAVAARVQYLASLSER